MPATTPPHPITPLFICSFLARPAGFICSLRSRSPSPPVYIRFAWPHPPPHLIYMRLAWPHPEGITPECRSVGEVELRFRGTIRPERPHRLSDPPPRQPHASLPVCPPITPYFHTLRWAPLRSPTPPLPVAPFIYMLAARPHPSPSPPLSICSLRSQGPDLSVRSSQSPSPLMYLRCAWVVPPQAPMDVRMARHRGGVAPSCEVLRILTGAGAASHDRPGWMLGVGLHPEGRFRRVVQMCAALRGTSI